MLSITTPIRGDGLRRIFRGGILALGLAAWLGAAEVPEANDRPEDPDGDVTTMAAFNVKDDRLEDFGFRVSPAYDVKRSSRLVPRYTPVVDVLLPNTAATKAGLRPGDRIVSSDGKSTASLIFSPKKWRETQDKKWKDVAAGDRHVTWTLEVEGAGTTDVRKVVLVVPTPSPHWGATTWQEPEDRKPATVTETGPLAERAKSILDNGLWILLRASYVRAFNFPINEADPFFLCYQWTQWDGPAGHRIYVSQVRGHTDIIFEAISREMTTSDSKAAPNGSPTRALASATTVFAVDSRAFLTTPSGELVKAWRIATPTRQFEISAAEAQEEFEREKDFWLTRIGKVSPRWPLGLLPKKEEKKDEAVK